MPAVNGDVDGKVGTRQAIDVALRRVTRGTPVVRDGLAMTPLLNPAARGAPYLTLEDALALGSLTVQEASQDGRVPELLVINSAAQSVFILDGEHLLGAKQNRVVNLSLMVPPHSKMVIPVTCVEEGRWARRTEHFDTSPDMLFSSGRAAKMSQVSSSMKRGEAPRADQGAVWQSVDNLARRRRVSSATRSMASLPVGERLSVNLAQWGYTRRQIAERLGWPLGTVSTRIRRALKKLRDYLIDFKPS